MATAGDSTVPVVVDSAGEVDTEYQLLCLTLNSGVRIQAFAVALIDEKLLVAFPLTAWHKRTASKRALPPGSYSKPVVVELGVADPVERGKLQEDLEIKVWMGFLTTDLVPQLSVMTEEDQDNPFNHSFWESDSDELYPYAAGLVSAAQEHFAFETAGETPLDEPLLPASVASGSHQLESRLGRLEMMVGKLSSQLEGVLSPKGQQDAPAVIAPTPKRTSALN